MSKKVIYFNDDEILKGGRNPNPELSSRTRIQPKKQNCDNNNEYTNTSFTDGLLRDELHVPPKVPSTSSAAADTPPAAADTRRPLIPPSGLNNTLRPVFKKSNSNQGKRNTQDENRTSVTSSSHDSDDSSELSDLDSATSGNLKGLRGGASESTQLNQLVEQLLATNMAKISNQLTSQSGGGLNITDVLSGINEQLSNLNTNIGKIIQLNNKNI